MVCGCAAIARVQGLRLCRPPCGMPPAFLEGPSNELRRGSASARGENHSAARHSLALTKKNGYGKPEAFRKEGGKPRTLHLHLAPAPCTSTLHLAPLDLAPLPCTL